MKNLIRVALVCCATAVLADATATAGPLRDRIREARPGIIFPKRSAPSCGSCQPAPVAPAPISDPGLDVRPFPIATAGGPIWLPASAGGCSGGSCPAPQYVPGHSYVIPAGGPCPGGACPAPQRFTFPAR